MVCSYASCMIAALVTPVVPMPVLIWSVMVVVVFAWCWCITLYNLYTLHMMLIHVLLLVCAWLHCYSEESISLQLQQDQNSVCFDQSILLLCQHSDITSGIFHATQPSWKEDGDTFALDGDMYHSVTQINETHTVLELVPKRHHFIQLGAHNYTCFLSLAGGGIVESNQVQISPSGKLVQISFL